MWFCVKEGLFFQPRRATQQSQKYNFQGRRESSITKSLRDVYQKGTEKVEQKFKQEMYERFVERRLLPRDYLS